MAKKTPKSVTGKSAEPLGDCFIPPAIPKGELHKLLFKQSEKETQDIKDYVEWQARGEEKVLHAEKVASERVFGREYDCGMSIPTKGDGGSLRVPRISILRR